MDVRNETALILVGHGSQISLETGDLVWRQVDRLRALQVVDEVTAAFWKEPPAYSQVLRTVTVPDVTIVPLFTATGFFTSTVIPTEMALSGPFTQQGDRTIRYTQTFGSRDSIAQMVQASIADALRESGAMTNEVAIAILGHATKRDPNSRLAAEQVADQIRQQGIAREVVALYLDDTPDISELYERTTAPVIIAVPYFLALGSHAGIDVPHRIGLAFGQTHATIQGRTVYYTPVLGADDDVLTNAILDLAREAGTPLREPIFTSDSWRGFPRSGADQVIAAYERGDLETFGQVALMSDEARHIDDRDIQADMLTARPNPADLSNHVRQESGFRPLPTGTDLPRGWRVPLPSAERVHAVLETIYPGSVTDWAAAQTGTFQATPFADVIARQVGQFRTLSNLGDSQRIDLVDRVCSTCVRTPTWHDDRIGSIPCAEPCNFWLSTALASITIESEVAKESE
jgi:sirohydrochlorin cobaltochelatase